MPEIMNLHTFPSGAEDKDRFVGWVLLYYRKQAQVKGTGICKIILAFRLRHTIDEFRKLAGTEFFTKLQAFVRRL